MSKVLYYHTNSFPEISQRDEYKLATNFALHSPRFRVGFDNQLDLVENPFIEFPTNFTSTFEELTNRRAIELWDIGKPVRLWWCLRWASKRKGERCILCRLKMRDLENQSCQGIHF